jgi:hypothetical protein
VHTCWSSPAAFRCGWRPGSVEKGGVDPPFGTRGLQASSLHKVVSGVTIWCRRDSAQRSS